MAGCSPLHAAATGFCVLWPPYHSMRTEPWVSSSSGHWGTRVARPFLSAVGVVALSAASGASVRAADLPLQAPPAPIWTWDGFYLGSEGDLTIDVFRAGGAIS